MVEHLNEIKEIKNYALENKVPIMMDDGIDFLTTFIIKNQIKSVNIKKLNLEDRITLIFNDALEVKLSDKFDLIFIDAAKSQSIHFFEQFSRNLNNNGFIITDNMDFHGYVKKDEKEIKSRNLR